MPLVPLHLVVPSLIACAVFFLGFTAWRRRPWSAQTFLFVSVSFVVGFWLTGFWIQGLLFGRTSSMAFVSVWQVLFSIAISFAPALAVHFFGMIQRRHEHGLIAILYGISLSIAVLFSSLPFIRFFGGGFVRQEELLARALPLGISLYVVAACIAICVRFLPTQYSASRPLLERRRETYAFLLMVLFLAGGAIQILPTPSPWIFVGLNALSVGFFLLAAAAFARVQFLGVMIESLESFLMVVGSGFLVAIFRSRDYFDFLVTVFASLVVLLFGIQATREARDGASHLRELESVRSELQNLEQAKSEFVAIVAHQLRSPLGGIRFASDMMVKGDYGVLSEQAKKAAGLMKQTAERLLSLAETSLTAAKFDVNAFHASPVRLDVRHEIRMLIDEASLFAQAKGLELVASVDTLPDEVVIDREVLRNVVFNVIDNAIKYTDIGRVTVEARVIGSRLAMTVSDTGIGLRAEQKGRLFQRFYRGDQAVQVHHQGVGLGLYVTKRLVEAVGGSIVVTSRGQGKGTTFRIELPVSRVDGSSPSQVRYA